VQHAVSRLPDAGVKGTGVNFYQLVSNQVSVGRYNFCDEAGAMTNKKLSEL
jgi:hypothetical protein